MGEVAGRVRGDRTGLVSIMILPLLAKPLSAGVVEGGRKIGVRCCNPHGIRVIQRGTAAAALEGGVMMVSDMETIGNLGDIINLRRELDRKGYAERPINTYGPLLLRFMHRYGGLRVWRKDDKTCAIRHSRKVRR